MVHLGKIKWPFYEILVAILAHKVCLLRKLLPRANTFLAQCQYLERFPQNLSKKLSFIVKM